MVEVVEVVKVLQVFDVVEVVEVLTSCLVGYRIRGTAYILSHDALLTCCPFGQACQEGISSFDLSPALQGKGNTGSSSRRVRHFEPGFPLLESG